MKVVPRPEDTEIIWKPDITLPKHPNGMVFEAISQGQVIDSWTVYSIGGGALWDEIGTFDGGDVYPTTSMSEVIRWCLDEGCT